MTQVSNMQVISAMHQYGGGFVSRLAAAWLHADDSNQDRLKDCFPELWAKYECMAVTLAHLREAEAERLDTEKENGLPDAEDRPPNVSEDDPRIDR